MNSKWGDDDARENARQIVTSLSLHNTLLRAVSEYFRSEREATEVLGDIFTALRREHQEDYDLAVKRVLDRRCKDCDKTVSVRGYCKYHYNVHYRVGDLGHDREEGLDTSDDRLGPDHIR